MDVLVGHDDAEWAEARLIIITMILETDSARHFDLYSKFRVKTAEFLFTDPAHRLEILSMGLKCADAGHCAKSTDVHV